MIAYALSAALFLVFVAASWGLAYCTFVLMGRLMEWNERRHERAMRWRTRNRQENLT